MKWMFLGCGIFAFVAAVAGAAQNNADLIVVGIFGMFFIAGVSAVWGAKK